MEESYKLLILMSLFSSTGVILFFFLGLKQHVNLVFLKAIIRRYMGGRYIQFHPPPRPRVRRRRNVRNAELGVTLDELLRAHQNRSLRLRRRMERDLLDDSLEIFDEN